MLEDGTDAGRIGASKASDQSKDCCDNKEEDHVCHPRLKRALRISLRTMFVILTMLCALLAWRVRQAERQKEVVAWVEETGGVVEYDFERDDRGMKIPDPALPGLDWLRELIGVDYFATVTHVWMSGSQAKELSLLAALTHLRFLSASRNSITDLSPLKKLTKLKSLFVATTQVRDLSPLAGLSKR